jgi:hypothetical protein
MAARAVVFERYGDRVLLEAAVGDATMHVIIERHETGQHQ